MTILSAKPHKKSASKRKRKNDSGTRSKPSWPFAFGLPISDDDVRCPEPDAVLRPPLPHCQYASHVIVSALAGTGKTTTIIEGLKAMKGLPVGIAPSPQQLAIWDEIAKSKGRDRFVTFAAFNSSIAAELKHRVPPGVEAKTIHSIGYSAIRRSFANPVPEVREDTAGPRTERLLAELLGVTRIELKVRNPVLLGGLRDLVSLCKLNLRSGTMADIDYLCDRHNIELGICEGIYSADQSKRAVEIDRRRRWVAGLVARVLDRAKYVRKDNTVDYDDMVWLPVVLGLNVFKSDLLLCDECQDMNPCQQAIAMMAGSRLVLVGDKNQAIYGFAGADSESMGRMESALDQAGGCVVLPLTVTRRCGRAIVDQAKRYVDDFEAHESNPDGIVRTAKYTQQRIDGKDVAIPDEESYLPMVRDGDMVICRTNAPLVRQYFKFLRRGQPAFILGRKDVAKQIASLVTKQKAETIPELIRKVGEWYNGEIAKEKAKSDPVQSKLDSISDRYECVIAFAESAESVASVLDRIDGVFSDSTRAGIRMSSVHKAKGLESARVFFLSPDGWPDRRPLCRDWEWEQELNLRYVGITRAIEELTYVF